MLYKRCDCDRDRWGRCAHVWWTRFKIRGERLAISTGASNRAAAAQEEIRLKAHYRGRPDVGRSSGLRLSKLEAADLARARSEGVSDKQVAGLEYLWDGIVAHFGEDHDPNKITYDALEAYRNARLRQVSGDTVRREFQALRRAFKIMRRRGFTDYEPIDWPKVRSKQGRRGRASTAGKWHPLEVITAWLAELDDGPRLLAEVILATGLRLEESRRLSIEWIEPAPAGWQCSSVLCVPDDSSKTDEGRVIPLGEDADRLVRAFAATAPEDRPKSRRTAWELARRRIKYGRTITARDLRHVALTVAEQRTNDRKATADLGGHTTTRTTGRYLHSDPTRLSAVGAALGDTLADLRRGYSGGGTGGRRPAEDATQPIEKAGGRRRDRTADILLVSPECPSDFSNIESLEAHRDHASHGEQADETPEGVHEGGTGRSGGGTS